MTILDLGGGLRPKIGWMSGICASRGEFVTRLAPSPTGRLRLGNAWPAQWESGVDPAVLRAYGAPHLPPHLQLCPRQMGAKEGPKCRQCSSSSWFWRR
jgi:hypothetical protein